MRDAERNAFAELAIAFLEGDADEAQVASLNAQLEADAEKRALFVDLSLQPGLLKEAIGSELVEQPEQATARRFSYPAVGWTVLAAAACVLVAVGIWQLWPDSVARQVVEDDRTPPVATPPVAAPQEVQVVGRWRITPTGDADFQVDDSMLVRLDRGELLIESTENENPGTDGDVEASLHIETPCGKVVAKGTRFYVGTHKPTERGESVMFAPLTRVLVLSGVVTLSTAVGSIEGTAGDLLAAEADKAPTKLVVRANSDFAFDLYKQLAKENEGKNLFFSPYSISSALAMTMEGARGQTMKEMGDVLGFPQAAQRTGDDAQKLPWETSQIHTGFAQLNERFNRKDKPYQLSVANALWGKIGYPWDPAYVDKINKSYKTGGIFPMDFAGDPDGSRRHINQWVEDRTEDRIKELIPPPAIDSDTALVLTNAIFFKGNWARPFDKKKTRILDFTREDRSTVKVPIMSRRFSLRVGHAKLERDSYVTLYELPYVGEDLSMVLINGRSNPYGPSNPLKAIEKHLTAENLDKWLGTLRKEDGVAIRLPRFKMELKYTLNDTLKAMGMPAAFGAADFSGLTTSPNGLFIDLVLHKGFIEVNEEGTEAAAATAVILKESAPPEFDGTRPFIYLIRDNTSGAILFMGRVMDPTKN